MYTMYIYIYIYIYICTADNGFFQSTNMRIDKACLVCRLYIANKYGEQSRLTMVHVCGRSIYRLMGYKQSSD